MVRRNRIDDGPSNHERWLLTYADLITLLLAFFIVLYSISRIDAKKFDNVTEALQGVLGGGSGIIPGREAIVRSDWSKGGPLKIGNLRLMQSRVQQAVVAAGMQDDITPIIDERGLVVHVTESALFDEGSAELNARARPALSVVAKSLKGLANSLRIEGHTDSRPINTARFPSNWELSTARAATVVRLFVEEQGWEPDQISAMGYGEFRPIVTNDTPENMAKNRRVDIVVLSTELSMSEPAGMPYTFSDSINIAPRNENVPVSP